MPDDKPTPAPEADAATEDQLESVLEDDTSEEAFAAAFDEFAATDDTTEETPPLEAEEPDNQQEDEIAVEAKDEPKDEAKDEASADIWADATPAQKAAFEAAEHENKSNRTRASAQNRKIREYETQAAAQPAAAPEPDGTWETFEEEYPEVAGPMKTRLDALEADNAVLRGQVNGLTQGQRSTAISAQEAVLEDRHHGFAALIETQEFQDWVPQQPRYVQEGLARNGKEIVDGEEAASLLDLFTASQTTHPEADPPADPPKDPPNTGKTTRRQRRLETAVSTTGGSPGPGSGPGNHDYDAAFDHFASLP